MVQDSTSKSFACDPPCHRTFRFAKGLLNHKQLCHSSCSTSKQTAVQRKRTATTSSPLTDRRKIVYAQKPKQPRELFAQEVI